MERQRSIGPIDSTAPQGASGPQRRFWTPDQLVRLENEWRRLQRNYAYHPLVRIMPLSGNPPCEFQIDFSARTLHIRGDGQLDYLTTPSVHIWLPDAFPHEPPLVRPMQSIFHPNVVPDGVLLVPPWQATLTLDQLVRHIGALLVFQTYDPYTVWNPAAMEWLNANTAYLPTDPAADFAPDVPDDPLERICRNGPATLQQLREQLEQLCTSMLQPAEPPTADEVYAFAEQIRLAVGLFMEDDVPDSLRERARELDEWGQALPLTVMTFESLRQRHIAAAAALQAAGKVAEARRALLKEMASLEQLCQAAPRNVAEALAALPEPAQLDNAQASLKVVTAEAQKRLAAAQARLAQLKPPDPRGSQTLSDLLETRIESEIKRAATHVEEGIEKTRSAIETITPAIERAGDELAALAQIIGWREFADLNTRARLLVEKLIIWGSAGAQAYFISGDAGSFGPYEFEQRLEFGEWSLVCRNTGRTAIEVWDIRAGKRLGASETGQITIGLKTADGTRYPTTFNLTERCDELWIQVEYLTRAIGDLLVKQAKSAPAARAQTWAAGFARMLSNPAVLTAIVEATRKDVQRRNGLVADLKTLARYKERLTTSFLLERHGEAVPQLIAQTKQARADLAHSNERIAYIFARSQRDLEHDQPMVPPKFASEYEEKKNLRDNSLLAIEHARRLMEIAVQQIMPRLNNPTLYGINDPPAPTVLPPLPAELLDRSAFMAEDIIDQQVTALEEQLNVELRPRGAAPLERPAEFAAAQAVDGDAMVETTPSDFDPQTGSADAQPSPDPLVTGNPPPEPTLDDLTIGRHTTPTPSAFVIHDDRKEEE